MYIKNREEYCKIPISALNFSTRTFNCLMRANISTLYLLIENIENLEEIRNMGSKSIAEINEVLHAIEANGISVGHQALLLLGASAEVLCGGSPQRERTGLQQSSSPGYPVLQQPFREFDLSVYSGTQKLAVQ